MTISATNSTSAFISKVDFTRGDDPAVILRALQGLRVGNLAKALSSGIDATSAGIQSASRDQDLSNLILRLQAMPDTPDGQSKVLATFSSGVTGMPGPQIPATTILNDLNSIEDRSLTLPKETWLYSFETPTLPAQSATPVLMSPKDVAKVKTECTLDHTEGGIDYYKKTTGSGTDQKTSYVAIYQSEGAYCAHDSDIAALISDMEARISESMALLNDQSARLNGMSGELLREIREDKPFREIAEKEDERHEERSSAALMPEVQGAPSAVPHARKG
ncbi:hypothetical protein [Variovorax soli]|uniref:Uncharacterized protein n=1 Tax=Variovorax soli TaxID=376815 RepID=A0ABU1NEP4_9BURK|nr:hypothetical protein [Variovorax soli]MDR6536930.1 hypothetical protein [Variovorax soli]